ncbi:hypothetical protein L6452_16717 [Arctium lappa]|uniref:Uncharacterized protein n=1 Tax=Arctium lappa TaxID=4217 RepID=A0ACB9C1A3_ARCLA|nr:hypothetical protein L6452_16717 [Arctium lappa]
MKGSAGQDSRSSKLSNLNVDLCILKIRSIRVKDGSNSINLEIGSESLAETGSLTMQPNSFAASKIAVPPPMVREETARVLKRELRKQSNRESARRSRLRKQAEREELRARVAGLRNENLLLREELQRLSVECDKLANQNMTMKDELCKSLGPEKLPELDAFRESRRR